MATSTETEKKDVPSLSPGGDTANQAPAHEFNESGRGRHAEKPSDIPAPGWMDILKRTFQQLGEDNLSIVAAGMAFYAFLAMVPALAALISIYALIADPATVTQHIESIAHVLPEQTRPILHDQLTRLSSNDEAAGWGVAVGIFLALFGAMKAVTALITGLNITYDESERRGFFKLYAVTFALTLAGIIGALLVIGLVAVGPTLVRVLGGGESAASIFKIVSWPLLAGLFMFALAGLYRYAPCRQKPQWRWVTWGATTATVLWMIGSAGFAFYASKFGGYEETYGSLGAIVIFLMWMYITSYVILLGSELDAEMERQTKKDTTTGPEKPMGQRGAHAADTLGAAKAKK